MRRPEGVAQTGVREALVGIRQSLDGHQSWKRNINTCRTMDETKGTKVDTSPLSRPLASWADLALQSIGRPGVHEMRLKQWVNLPLHYALSRTKRENDIFTSSQSLDSIIQCHCSAAQLFGFAVACPTASLSNVWVRTCQTARGLVFSCVSNIEHNARCCECPMQSTFFEAGLTVTYYARVRKLRTYLRRPLVSVKLPSGISSALDCTMHGAHTNQCRSLVGC